MFMFLTGLLRCVLFQQEDVNNSSSHHLCIEQFRNIQQQIDSYAALSTEVSARALQQTEEEEPRDAVDIVKDIIIILLSGTAIILVLLAITYMITKLTDHCDGRHPQGTYSWPTMGGGHPVGEDDIDRGSLTRKANLWGLRRSERLTILQEILKSTTTIYNSSTNMEPNSNCNFENQKNELLDSGDHAGDIEMGTVTLPSTSLSGSEREASEAEEENCLDITVDVEETCSGAQESGPTATASTKLDTLAGRRLSRHASTEDILNDAGARNYENLCCICLSEYKDGESVLTGTQCTHLFHATCCQEWLVQNDFCPYCRKEIVRPSEFRAAAVTFLGERRVQSLSLANVRPDRPVEATVDSSTVISQVNDVDPRSPSDARSPTSVHTSTAVVGNADSVCSDDEV